MARDAMNEWMNEYALIGTVTYLRWIVGWQRVGRLAVGGKGPLQSTLVGVERAKLEERRNPRSFVLATVSQTGAIQVRTLSQDGHGFLTPARSY